MRATGMQVQNALSRKGKEAAVEKLTAAFEESTAVFGIRFQKISVSVHLRPHRALLENDSQEQGEERARVEQWFENWI